MTEQGKLFSLLWNSFPNGFIEISYHEMQKKSNFMIFADKNKKYHKEDVKVTVIGM